MLEIERVLLAKRLTDGLFLRLDEQRHITGFDFVSDPCQAKRIYPIKINGYGEPFAIDEEALLKPHPADYYFENSYRAREYWTKGCVMVPYEITTEVVAKAL